MVAAARELAEEADLRAASWWRLVDFYTTPGGSNERILVFLARDLTPVAESDRHVRTDEEAGMVPVWVPLDEAVDAALRRAPAQPDRRDRRPGCRGRPRPRLVDARVGRVAGRGSVTVG